MKRKVYKICTFAFILVLLIGMSSGILLFNMNNAHAQLSDIELAIEYEKGTDFSIPQAKFTLGDKELDTTSELVFPSGKVFAKDKIELDEVGNYTLRYRAYDNNKQYVENKTFHVFEGLFSVSSNKSKAEYTTCNYFGEGLKTQGIALELFSGDTFTFNKVVDLRKVSPKDSLINVSITPKIKGDKDCNEVLIMLTDAYDRNNVVTVSTLAHPSYSIASVMKAGASNQDLSGYEDKKTLIHVKNQWGFPSYTAFDGIPGNQNPKNEAYFMFDYKTGTIKCFPRTGNSDIVAVLTDAYYFKNLWEGFTTGEVFVSIQASDYIKSTASFFINNIAGLSLDDTRVVDNEKPHIHVDLEGYDKNNLPDMVVGKPYKIYDATAIDTMNGKQDIKLSVYKNYNSTKENITIKDGYVTAKTQGKYTIEYKAKDFNGNENIVLLHVNAVNKAPEIKININKEDATKSDIVGNGFYLADCAPSGGCGNIDVKVEVFNDRQHFDCEAGQKISLLNVGQYTVKYTATDRANNIAIDSYSLIIMTGNRPVFTSEPVLPKYLIASSAIILPTHYAYNFTDGSKDKILSKISVIDKNGLHDIEKNVFVPQIENNGDKVTIIYSAKLENGGNSELRYDIPVYYVTDENNKIKLEKYFKLDNMSVFTPSKAHYIEFTNKADDSGLEFINALLADGLYTKFSLDTKIGAKSFDITLTDFADEKVALKFVFTRDDNVTKFSVVGNNNKYEIKSATFTNGSDFSIKYYNSSRRLIFDEINKTSVIVDKTMYGEDFRGFPSGRAYLSFNFQGERNNFKVMLKTINEQNLGDIDRILSKPKIGFYPISQDFTIGNQVELKPSVACDVFDTYVEFAMTVTNPDGSITKDINGLALENVDPTQKYTIDLTSYGNYNILYSSKNSYGRTENDKGFIIRVIDVIAPKIIIKENIVSSAKVGDSIFIPKGIATDNVDKQLKVSTYVKNPIGVMTYINLEEYDGFTATVKGNYRVYYSCYDAAGNMAYQEFVVTVE